MTLSLSNHLINSRVFTLKNGQIWPLTSGLFLRQGEQSGLDHSFSSLKDELLLCDDALLPSRKIIGDRGGPASMKENICQVSFTQRSAFARDAFGRFQILRAQN